VLEGNAGSVRVPANCFFSGAAADFGALGALAAGVAVDFLAIQERSE
jgi:hypothetical protein